MTTRRKWTAIPGFLALAAAATVVSAYSGASSSQYNSPEQPVAFPHPRHAGAVNAAAVPTAEACRNRRRDSDWYSGHPHR